MAYYGKGSNGQILTDQTAPDMSKFSAPAASGTVTSVSGTANQVGVATGTTTPVISLIGPYTPATYTAHGVLVGEGTSSIVALADGSAGQVLQSGGASADPAYSTPTYPSASGTSRTILVSNGTNNVYSTETWAVPGSSGNVLTSDGTNWTSAAAPGGVLSTATITLTSAQIKALNVTPIQIVAAPGAGNIVSLVNCNAKFTYGGSNAFTSSGGEISLYYGSTTPCLNGLIQNTPMIGTTTLLFTGGSGALGIAGSAPSNLENVALNAFNPNAVFNGNAAGNNTVTITVLYYITSI